MRRIIIVTGKGGVGKTSIAAAHALRSAADGKRTLLLSTDMAHNLGDLFRIPVGSRITVLSENLDAMELDPDEVMHRNYPDLQNAFGNMLSGKNGRQDALSSELVFPGLEGLFCLLPILDLWEAGSYERIIVDCAPSGETLSLLKLPELLASYMERFFPVGRTMVRALRPVSKARFQIELPDGEAMDDISRLHKRLMELSVLLKNSENCSVRLVCTPEKMAVAETERDYMYLHLYGYPLERIFVNRVLPKEMTDPFFDRWKERQAEYLEQLRKLCGPLPLTAVKWYPEDLCGIDAVKMLSKDLFSGESEDAVFAPSAPQNAEYYEKTESGYRIVIPSLSAALEEARVSRKGKLLSVRVLTEERTIPLPDVLTEYEIIGVHTEKGLTVEFGRRGDETTCGY